jgi:hypothetical protein
MPQPTDKELKENDQKGYMDRCMAVRNSEGNHDQPQNAAICHGMWREAKKKTGEDPGPMESQHYESSDYNDLIPK